MKNLKFAINILFAFTISLCIAGCDTGSSDGNGNNPVGATNTSNKIWVEPYYRDDGTYVSGYWRDR